MLGKAVGSRIDPLQIEKFKLYEAADGEWTALEGEAVMAGNKPKPFKKKHPSEINHGNIVPTIRDQGITAEKITLKWAMPMAAICPASSSVEISVMRQDRPTLPLLVFWRAFSIMSRDIRCARVATLS